MNITEIFTLQNSAIYQSSSGEDISKKGFMLNAPLEFKNYVLPVNERFYIRTFINPFNKENIEKDFELKASFTIPETLPSFVDSTWLPLFSFSGNTKIESDGGSKGNQPFSIYVNLSRKDKSVVCMSSASTAISPNGNSTKIIEENYNGEMIIIKKYTKDKVYHMDVCVESEDNVKVAYTLHPEKNETLYYGNVSNILNIGHSSKIDSQSGRIYCPGLKINYFSFKYLPFEVPKDYYKLGSLENLQKYYDFWEINKEKKTGAIITDKDNSVYLPIPVGAEKVDFYDAYSCSRELGFSERFGIIGPSIYLYNTWPDRSQSKNASFAFTRGIKMDYYTYLKEYPNKEELKDMLPLLPEKIMPGCLGEKYIEFYNANTYKDGERILIPKGRDNINISEWFKEPLLLPAKYCEENNYPWFIVKEGIDITLYICPLERTLYSTQPLSYYVSPQLASFNLATGISNGKTLSINQPDDSPILKFKINNIYMDYYYNVDRKNALSWGEPIYTNYISPSIPEEKKASYSDDDLFYRYEDRTSNPQKLFSLSTSDVIYNTNTIYYWEESQFDKILCDKIGTTILIDRYSPMLNASVDYKDMTEVIRQPNITKAELMEILNIKAV